MHTWYKTKMLYLRLNKAKLPHLEHDLLCYRRFPLFEFLNSSLYTVIPKLGQALRILTFQNIRKCFFFFHVCGFLSCQLFVVSQSDTGLTCGPSKVMLLPKRNESHNQLKKAEYDGDDDFSRKH